MMFSHSKIHKYNRTCSEGNTRNQIGHVLIDRRWHSSLLDVRSFRGADCDTDHYLLVAKVRERLAVSKRAAQNVDMDRLNLKKLNEGVLKNSIRLQSETSLQLWKTWRTVGISTGHWTILERTSKFRAKKVYVTVNQSTVNHGLMRDVQNWFIDGRRLNDSGCMTQVV
jgi:hypothetical protein